MPNQTLPGENDVDAHLEALVQEACKGKAFSKWALLTRSTDRIRLALTSGNFNVSFDLAGTFHASLRYGFRVLSRVAAEGQLHAKPNFSDTQGASFFALLKALDTYDQIARLYAFAHNGLISMHHEGSRVSCELTEDIWPLEVFEIMDNNPPSITSIMYFCCFLSHEPTTYARLDPNACLESRILRSTTRGGRYRIRYDFDPGVLRELRQHFMPASGVCPGGWRCAGLNWSAVERFNASLMAIAYYQTVAVFGGGRMHRIVGAGDNQIVCVRTAHELKSLIAESAELRAEELDVLFKLYTYDEAVTWADPALTPLIPLQGERYALDPALVMLSNWERNTLKVLARGKRREFDAVSGAFEVAMLKRISASLQPLGVSVRTGRTVAGEEIDLLAFDEAAGLLLIGEAKWEIRASDPFEMVRARKSAIEKHAQLTRKIDALSNNIDSVAAVFGCQGSAIKRCVGVVILDGNMGLPRSHTQYPVVPGGALDAALSSSDSLAEVFEVLDEFSWTPKVNVQYELKEHQLEFGGLIFVSEGCRIMWERFSEYSGWGRTPHANLHGLV